MTSKRFMQLSGRLFFVLLSVMFGFIAFSFYYRDCSSFSKPVNHNATETIKSESSGNSTILRIKQKALQVKSFIKNGQLDRQVCFLIDMRIPSGKNRFFIYNLQKDSIIAAGLVTHGSGSDSGTDELTFSNRPNSHCTSLGKYKTGNAYSGDFGLAYKLHGLEESNSKAYERFVVLHAHSCVPEREIWPQPLCVSYGCPTVSPSFLTKLKAYINSSSKPVLIWIYY